MRNVFPTKLQDKSSLELFTGKRPSVGNIRVFGCSATVYIAKEVRDKLDYKSEEGILLDCLPRLVYKVWLPSRKTAVLARHVRFRELRFPGRYIFYLPGSLPSGHEGEVQFHSHNSDDDTIMGSDEEKRSAEPDPLLYIPGES